MALQVDRREVDEFCSKLFCLLDSLGLLPRYLGAKPTEFEKYPRLLFGSIQRYNDVEAGFREWEGRVLRDAPYRKEECYLDVESLRQWMVQHTSLFTSKVNMQHLRTSLYARVFQYLYPRRVLVNAYCFKHHGNVGAIEPDFLAQELPGSVAAATEPLKKAYEDEWDTIVADAQATLLANAGYYRKVWAGREPIAPAEMQAAETTPETDQPQEASQ